MKSFRPYVSVDIETTGLSDESEVLQIAGVIDDGISDIKDLTTIDLKIKYNKFNHSEPFALMLNAGLIKDMTNRDLSEQFLKPEDAANHFLGFLGQAKILTEEYDSLNDIRMRGKIICAGKNYASFDDPKLRLFLERYAPAQGKTYDQIVSYKTLDVGSMYYLDFGYNPSLSQINEITGRKEVSHDAIDDALDVVYAVRHKASQL
jgi:oligoribonuclease (3'-5' exoribonuclease)